MDFSQYSGLAIRTANTPSLKERKDKLTCASLGIAGEGGEVADHIKKYLFQGHDLEESKLIKEAGDILWYLNLLADALGISLEQIAAQNISKLAERYPGGLFTVDRSRNRKE